MLKKIMDVIVLLVILAGMGAVSYPSFSTYVNQRFANDEIVEYQQEMDQSSQETLDTMKRMADAYNASLPISFPADPFSGQNISDFTGTEFEDFFMVQQGSMLGYIEIPKLDIYLPIYYGTTDEVLNEGLGVLENTSLPVGGANTHSVISGHSGLASKKLFTDLNLLEEDDIFFIHVLNSDFAYQVNQIKVVLPYETDDLYIEENRDYVTLLTCTPFGVNDHRLLVRGERIDYDFSVAENISVSAQVIADKYLWMYVFGFGLFIFAIILIRKIVRRNKKKRQSSPD